MPYPNSLASVADPEEFAYQVKIHSDKIHELFGQRPKVLRNTELIYCDEMAPQFLELGFKGAVTEGAKHILGWKSPNYIYSAASAPKLKLLLDNIKLTEDITRRFSDSNWESYPLTADKYIDWIAATPQEEQIITLCMNLDTFGELQPRETGIFQFLEALPRFAAERGIEFWTASEALSKIKAVDSLSVMHPISAVDESHDMSAWLGNRLQNEAFAKLYSVAERVRLCDDRRLKMDYLYLQGSDHFYYMSTKNMADGAAHANFSPYETPLCCLHKLHECPCRLHSARRGAISHVHRERGTQLSAHHHPQPGHRNRKPEQGGDILTSQHRAIQRGAYPAQRQQKAPKSNPKR